MHLVTFRIIGHPAIPNAPWLRVAKGLNIIKALDAEQAKSLFKMLQAINPPYDFQETDPFGDLPLYPSIHHQIRKVIPSKKTAVIAIFAAPLELVRKLVTIDPVFFETDRIECGRRRDHSRWINFVELSSSTRWSEIESIVKGLLANLGPDAVSVVQQLQNTMIILRNSDRIKGITAMKLRRQLEELRQFMLVTEQAQVDKCLHAVDRTQRFRQAKDVAEKHLPIFLTITSSMLDSPIQKADNTSAMEIRTALIDFLIKRLENGGDAEAVSLKHRLHRISISLQTIDCELAPHFREEGNSIILDGARNGVPLPFTEMLPVSRVQVLLSALSALHNTLYDLDPIFLIDISEIKPEMPEMADLFLRHSSQKQLLVIPNDAFLAFCSDALSEKIEDEHHLVTLIDLTEEA